MSSSRSRRILLVILILLIALALLLLSKCSSKRTPPPRPSTESTAPAAAVETPKAEPLSSKPGAPRPEERLTPATVKGPEHVVAGAPIEVTWTGPANDEDYITIVSPEAVAARYENYALITVGNPLRLNAPVKPGTYELRYVAGRSKTVLGKTPIVVDPAPASLDAPMGAFIGSSVKVTWTGPNNEGDYITIVPKAAPDNQSGAYTLTARGNPLEITAPATDGAMELRYLTGQGHRVLARRDLTLSLPQISLSAPDEVTQGNDVTVEWSGPSNPGDYITIVAKSEPDGRYGNYNTVGRSATVSVQSPMIVGDAEIRFMTAQGARVLGRRTLRLLAARVTLEAPDSAAPGASVLVKWDGPKNRGDYVTIVPKTAPDAQVGRYVDATQKGEGAIIVPNEPGVAEIRYVSGQGRKILARRALEVK